jgi:D-3-phosphoglycerate dehydrogenase
MAVEQTNCQQQLPQNGSIPAPLPVEGGEPRKTRSGSFTAPKPRLLKPFNTAEIKILLLENINTTAVEAFKKQGYQVCV